MGGKSNKYANNSQPNNSRGGEIKVMKKFVNALLAFVLVFALAMPAMAAAPSDVAGTDYEDAVAKLTALGVLNGYPDGTFRPANDITRAEFAKIIVIATGKEAAADLLKGTSAFSDIDGDEWYAGYVAAAASYGYIKGYPDGTFQPKKNITGQEVVTVLLRALGYNDELPGNWPFDYLIKANELGLFEGTDFAAAVNANRGLVAQLTSATLDQKVVAYDADADKFDVVKDANSNDVIFVNDKLGADFKTAVVTEPELDADGKILLDGTATAFATDAYVGAWALGQNVNYLLNDDNEITYLAPATNYVVNGTVDENGKLIVDDVEYTFSGATIFYNGVQDDSYTLVEGDNVKAFLSTEDGTAVRFAVVDGYDLEGKFVASTTETSRYQYVDYTDGGFYVDEDTVITLNGASATFDDIKEGQVLYVSFPGGDTSKTAIKVDLVEKSVTGKVTRIKDSEYTINGVAYKSNVVLSLGTEYTVTLDKDDVIVKAVEVTEETTENTTVVGYYLSSEEYNVLDENNKITQVVDIKVANLDGDVVTYRATVSDVDNIDTGYALNGLYTFTIDADGKAVVDSVYGSAADFTFEQTATIAEDGVGTSSVTFDTYGKFNVTSDTKIWQISFDDETNEVVVKTLTLADLSEYDEVQYVVDADDAFSLAYIFLTAEVVSTSDDQLDPVYGFAVATSQEQVLEGEDTVTYTYLTLNVDGTEVTYTVDNDTTLPDLSSATPFVKLTDEVTVDGTFDMVTVLPLSDATVTFDGNVFSLDNGANEYVFVDGTTKVLVKTVDTTGDETVTTYELGAYFNVQDAKYDQDLQTPEFSYKGTVVSSGDLFGGKEVADVIVIERTK
ncbi:hypothetical protein BHF71_00915 [Vulcanibacillus modesticaldus]|uniref:SLH domain-containing protein n=1 Tax=Vulcanibacillus modesticaldus TaxID=337097 RepID=A0A1D2YVK9_9BACI|nr:S-layer homology domain-containing protein [Vulcanibacillus modesticaldus]OEF99768.1 hypothetical protein BHF71_00915 [Vulcanibacillus modesticaldus]